MALECSAVGAVVQTLAALREHSSLEKVTCQVTDFSFYLVHSITAISAFLPLMFVHSPVPFVVCVIFHISIEPSVAQMTSSTPVKATPCILGQFGGGAVSILCWMEGTAPLTPSAEAKNAFGHAGAAQ